MKSSDEDPFISTFVISVEVEVRKINSCNYSASDEPVQVLFCFTLSSFLSTFLEL